MKMAANEKDEKADVTLTPNVRHAEMDFRRDTGVYSSDGLSTPADFQRSREYQSPYFDEATGVEDFGGNLGPSPGLRGRQPAQAEAGAWPETPGGSHFVYSPMSGHPSYVSETRGGGRRLGDKYYGVFVVDVERELTELL